MTTIKERFQGFKKKLYSDITEVPECFKQSHFPGLDGLRGISILMVIACHFAMYTSLTDYFYGDVGVEIFFVISGFLITTLLLKEKVRLKSVSLKNFYIRRALRIIPVAYLFLIVLICLNDKLNLHIYKEAFLPAFLYIKNIPFKSRFEWYTGHFWSLSVEEQFYFLFPILIVCQTNRFLFFAISSIFLVPVLSALVFNNIGIFYSNHITHLVALGCTILLGKGTNSIFVGALYSILIFKRIIVIDKLKNKFFLSFGLFLLACCTLTKKSIIHIDYLSELLFPFLIGYVIILNLKGRNFFTTILKNKILVDIGILSYSLYIWQELFTTKQNWNFFPFCNNIIVRCFLLFVVAYFSYNYFEKIFLRYKSKFKSV